MHDAEDEIALGLAQIEAAQHALTHHAAVMLAVAVPGVGMMRLTVRRAMTVSARLSAMALAALDSVRLALMARQGLWPCDWSACGRGGLRDRGTPKRERHSRERRGEDISVPRC